jgi:hypothetical protein
VRHQGRGLRVGFGLLCLAAVAALLATAGGGRDGRDATGIGDPDAGQTAPPPQPNAPKTSPNAYFSALRQAQLVDSSGPSLSWTPVGTGPITGGYGPSETTPPFSGRGTSIAVSGNVANDETAYLGTAEGGVWKTTDDGATWTSVFDSEPTLAIGAVAVDPTNSQNVYVGTGEANWSLQGGQVLLGNGIYRSTNGGTTWSRSTIPFSSGYMGGGCGVQSLVVDPDDPTILLAAVFCPGTSNTSATPFIRSTDSGQTWTGVGPVVGANEDMAPMLTVDPNDGTTWYATIAATGGSGGGNNGVWKSTDSGQTWTQKKAVVDSGHLTDWAAPRGVVAVAPSDSNRLYALFQGAFACPASGQGSCLDCAAGACGNAVTDPQLLTSADGGDNWHEFTNVDSDPFNHQPAAFYLCGLGNTCSVNMTMAVSPTDSSRVYFGSLIVQAFTSDGTDTTCEFYNCGVSAFIHGDEHAFVFDAEGRLWAGNDGGIYRFDHESDVDTAPQNLNATLPTIQVYRLSVGSDGKILIATQDQGCDLYDPGTQVWSQWAWGPYVVGCGDAASAVISSVHPGVMYSGTQYNGWIVRTPANPPQDGQPWDHLFTAPGTNPFMTPLVEEPVTGALLTGGGDQVWRLADPDTTAGYSTADWMAISPQFPWYPGAIAVANAKSSTQTIYVGSSAYSNSTSQMGIEYTHDGGDPSPTWTASNGCCGYAPVTDIEVDPTHPNHAYATTSSWPPQAPRDGLTQNNATSQVYETTDGGANWHVITGDLPAAPYNAIAVDWNFSKQTLYLATDVGVFWSEDDGQIWHATSSGMPTVSVEDLAIQTVSGTKSLYAATFGRGVYSVPTITTVLHTLSVSKSGSGSGTITSDGGEISCGSICAYDFADASVTLTAAAAPGSTFTGWSGDCAGTASTCQLEMNGDHSATATFVPNPILSVSKQGDGSGTVTSDPGGLSCGSTCAKDFAPGTQVTLTATAAAGSTFTGWSGDCAGATATCQLPMDSDHSATATFVQNPVLTVATAGSGNGSVTSDPSGIDCGSTCSHDFGPGTQVTLTAAAAAGSAFTGWSGDCSGTSTTCQVTMSAARSATATFAASPPPPPPVKCVVPKLKGKTLAAAKRLLHKAHCTLGKVKKKSSSQKTGAVIGQSPRSGTKKPQGFPVNVIVSKGRPK